MSWPPRAYRPRPARPWCQAPRCRRPRSRWCRPHRRVFRRSVRADLPARQTDAADRPPAPLPITRTSVSSSQRSGLASDTTGLIAALLAGISWCLAACMPCPGTLLLPGAQFIDRRHPFGFFRRQELAQFFGRGAPLFHALRRQLGYEVGILQRGPGAFVQALDDVWRNVCRGQQCVPHRAGEAGQARLDGGGRSAAVRCVSRW